MTSKAPILKAASIVLALGPAMFASIPLLATPFAATSASAQEPSYSMEDVTACSQDAMRLCKDRLPDLEQIETCMKEHYESLRPACRARFNRN